MNKFIAVLLSSLVASTAFAASDGKPETAGSAKAQAAAEAKHNALPHGIDNSAKQPEVQAAGSDGPKSKAEAKHLKKSHGKTNNAADDRMKKDASKL